MDPIAFAWSRVKNDFFGVVGPIFLGHIVAFLPILLITGGTMGYVMTQLRPGQQPNPNDPVLLGSHALTTIVTWFTQGFMSGGITLFALRTSRGEATNFGDVFSGGRFFGPSFVVACLTSMLFVPATVLAKIAVAAGAPAVVESPIVFALSIPGMVVTLGWITAMPFVVDRGLGGVAALGESWRLTRGHRLAVFVSILVLGCLAIPAACLCCLGMPVVMALGSLIASYVYLRLSGQPTAPAT